MLLLVLGVATCFHSHLLAPAQLFSCPSMVTLNINMLIHALSATETRNPTMLQLIVRKDYDQDVLFLKTSSMTSEEYWHIIATHHFHLIGTARF